MRRIDELSTADGNYIFYDGIDFNFINEYKGDDILVLYVDDWNMAINSLNRDNKINRLLKKEELNIDSVLDENLYVWIYQTSGYLETIHDTIKTKIGRLNNLQPWQIPKNNFGLKNINY
jgi:hypothetical protein